MGEIVGGDGGLVKEGEGSEVVFVASAMPIVGCGVMGERLMMVAMGGLVLPP